MFPLLGALRGLQTPLPIWRQPFGPRVRACPHDAYPCPLLAPPSLPSWLRGVVNQTFRNPKRLCRTESLFHPCSSIHAVLSFLKICRTEQSFTGHVLRSCRFRKVCCQLHITWNAAVATSQYYPRHWPEEQMDLKCPSRTLTLHSRTNSSI